MRTVVRAAGRGAVRAPSGVHSSAISSSAVLARRCVGCRLSVAGGELSRVQRAFSVGGVLSLAKHKPGLFTGSFSSQRHAGRNRGGDVLYYTCAAGGILGFFGLSSEQQKEEEEEERDDDSPLPNPAVDEGDGKSKEQEEAGETTRDGDENLSVPDVPKASNPPVTQSPGSAEVLAAGTVPGNNALEDVMARSLGSPVFQQKIPYLSLPVQDDAPVFLPQDIPLSAPKKPSADVAQQVQLTSAVEFSPLEAGVSIDSMRKTLERARQLNETLETAHAAARRKDVDAILDSIPLEVAKLLEAEKRCSFKAPLAPVVAGILIGAYDNFPERIEDWHRELWEDVSNHQVASLALTQTRCKREASEAWTQTSSEPLERQPVTPEMQGMIAVGAFWLTGRSEEFEYLLYRFSMAMEEIETERDLYDTGSSETILESARQSRAIVYYFGGAKAGDALREQASNSFSCHIDVQQVFSESPELVGVPDIINDAFQ